MGKGQASKLTRKGGEKDEMKKGEKGGRLHGGMASRASLVILPCFFGTTMG